MILLLKFWIFDLGSRFLGDFSNFHLNYHVCNCNVNSTLIILYLKRNLNSFPHQLWAEQRAFPHCSTCDNPVSRRERVWLLQNAAPLWTAGRHGHLLSGPPSGGPPSEEKARLITSVRGRGRTRGCPEQPLVQEVAPGGAGTHEVPATCSGDTGQSYLDHLVINRVKVMLFRVWGIINCCVPLF